MGFNTMDDVLSKLPGQRISITKGTSLTVGSPSKWRELWYETGVIGPGLLSDVLSINQGGTYFVSSHTGAWRFTNPNSVSAESCCIGRFSVWGKVPGDTVTIFDRVWAGRGFHANTNVTQSVASIAFVRTFDAAKAELWATIAVPIGSLNTNITVNWLDASDVAKTLTLRNPFSAFSGYSFITAPLVGVPLGNGGIKRVTSISINSNTGATGELAFVIRVPMAESVIGQNRNIQDALQTGMTLVSSDVCFEAVYHSNTINFDVVRYDLNLIIK
jgi:hypothetical protein